ncbi:MAG: hypothetical protein CO141_01740 [Candidatus Moranbacteria bacterium CG_4_9_14_3_um_filter_42_9]|nr:MAG: hypothetical protein CO141_01740 [Candidatus Moranbacteria bacterium CG_4_9_14_3_um_filter_42_9]
MPRILDKNYRTLDRLDKWDKVTQNSIKKRLKEEIGAVSSFDFLSEKEGKILKIITDIAIPQENGTNYIKIAEAVDKGLSDRKEGVRYGENPWSGEFYRAGLKAVGEYIEKNCAKPIEKMSGAELKDFFSKIIEERGSGLLYRFLRRVLSDAIGIYFSHPASWDKVGFPGPAYPEGYAYLDCGEKDDWEPKYEKYAE